MSVDRLELERHVDSSRVDQPGDRMHVNVLRGRHRGAVSALTGTVILIGRSPSADIVLEDSGVEDEHLLLLRRADGSWRVQVLGAQATLGAEPLVRGAQAAVGVGDLLVVGPVVLGFGPPDHDWANASAAPAPEPGVAQPGRLMAAAAIVAMLSLGIGLFVGLGQPLSASDARVPEDPAAIRAELASEIERLAQHELSLNDAGGGALELRGYVTDLQTFQKLRQIVAGHDVRLRVVASDQLVRFARDALHARGLQADVDYIGGGALAIRGPDDAAGKLREVVAGLPAELPGIARIDAEFIAPSPVYAAPAVPPENDPYVLAGVNGVNAGHAVPFLSAGDNYIFTGGGLGNGMNVMAIESDRVVVDDRGRRRITEVQVR